MIADTPYPSFVHRPVSRSSRWRLVSVLVALIAFSAAIPAAAQDVHEHESHTLGVVDFGASCAPAVQDAFDGAVALLHHMQYEEARAAFERIAADDPACAMAHWGVAMTLFQPLWPSRPDAATLQRGWDEVAEARRLGTANARDAALLAAAEAFYREPASAEWWTRIQRWGEAMERAYAAHPDDTETAALYALSQLAAGQVAAERMAYHERAADVLFAIYERQPAHPGAIHYTIHANDVDARADEALEIVRSYADIAPTVPHALHMPSHIYVRLGQWPEVIDWNRRSAEAALRLPAGDAISHHYLHAVDYLVYAHLQRGEDAKARALVEAEMAQTQPFQGTFISAFHLASLPARYAVERRAWDEARAIVPAPAGSVAWERFWWPEAISWFARGLGAAHTGDAEEAARAEARMVALRDAARTAGEGAFADYIEVDRLLLAARRARAAGDDDEAVRLAHAAVALEATTQKHPVTPGALMPAQEMLGDLLLELDRPAEALAAYEGALALWPGRYHSLLGAARAAHAAGRHADAKTYYRALVANTEGAASTRPGLAEAQAMIDG